MPNLLVHLCQPLRFANLIFTGPFGFTVDSGDYLVIGSIVLVVVPQIISLQGIVIAQEKNVAR